MKIKLLLLILFTTQLFSLSIVLNSAKVHGLPYSVLHIEDSEPIDCRIVPQSLDRVIYLCRFDKVIRKAIEPKKMALVDIDFLEKEKEFYIRIEPKVKSKLMIVNNSLFENLEVSSKVKEGSVKHWSILLYSESPFPLKKSNDGINFPIMYPKKLKPYIGALDLNGAPISYVQSKDIELFIRLKKSYASGRYFDVVEDSADALKKYPQTVFESEFMLYRLRAIDKGIDANIQEIAREFDRSDIVHEGKAWIKSFPSDSHIPEVLMLITKAYLKMGLRADANYFMDILVSEHEDSLYTKKAILLFADSLYNTRQKDKAIKLYRDVLYSAQDLDVATEAAMRLIDKEINKGDTQKARVYLLKILEANHEYLLKDVEASHKLADKLSTNGLHNIAAQISDVLLDGINKRDEIREIILRDSGLWHVKANNTQKAYSRLQQYLEEYKFGSYKDEVQAGFDELFFELNETNATKLEAHYNKLIDKYDNKIRDRALEEKAKLLLSQHRYKDVLKMQAPLEYINESNTTSEYIVTASTALVKLYLKEDRCPQVIAYIERYDLDIGAFNKEKVFECLIRTARYTKAKELSELHIRDGSLKSRSKWLQNYLLSLYRLNRYESVVEVGVDVAKITKSLKTKPRDETLGMIFFSLLKLDRFEKAIEIAKQIEKNSPNNLKNIDIFIKIVQRAKDDRNDLLLKEYANKIIALQKRHKSNSYTPEVEFSLIGALQRLNKHQEALVATRVLLDKDITLKQRTRAYYNAGELSMKLEKNEDAKEYFTKCKELEVESSWRDICEQNLKLL